MSETQDDTSQDDKPKDTPKYPGISAARVAEIWNERARVEKGVESHYTRFSVRSRRTELDGVETAIGWLYSEEKARMINLSPRSSGRPDRAEANKAPFKKKSEEHQA